MFNSVNDNDRIAVGRLLEFLTERTPWHRSLWGVGVLLSMEEVYEACIAQRQGHLSDGAVKRMCTSLQKRVGIHPVFTNAEKQFLRHHIEKIPRAEGAAHFSIRELSTRVSIDYMSRWARKVAASPVEVELFARDVAAHLLDAGFSASYLKDFIKQRLAAPEGITLAELCEALHTATVTNPTRLFDVLMAFGSVPELQGGVPDTWLRGPTVTTWLKNEGFSTTDVRAPVAMVLRVRARDEYGAAQAARSEGDRYAARALLASGKALNRLPMLWVQGSAVPTPMEGATRGVAVKELSLENRVFSTEASQNVDAALELLAHLEDSSPPAAIAGGWGAIEGLLADPSDRASAADNLATLVTCSFPRAELTRLSYRAERVHQVAGQELAAAQTNRDRCRILAKMISEARLPEMRSMADRAAVARMRKLLANPHAVLQRVRESVSDSFHRLYRQRNLILHGARIDSVALTPSLRTVAKLAGAGMDRITHGHYKQHLKPLELVAKANLSLALISEGSPLGCVDLLEAE